MLFNLNPFIRTDGYWIYQDLYENYKKNKKFKLAHTIYVFGSFIFTLWFTWHIVSNLIEIINNIKDSFIHKGNIGINFKLIFYIYLSTIIFKAGISKAKEVKNQIYEIMPHKKQKTP